MEFLPFHNFLLCSYFHSKQRSSICMRCFIFLGFSLAGFIDCTSYYWTHTSYSKPAEYKFTPTKGRLSISQLPILKSIGAGGETRLCWLHNLFSLDFHPSIVIILCSTCPPEILEVFQMYLLIFLIMHC